MTASIIPVALSAAGVPACFAPRWKPLKPIVVAPMLPSNLREHPVTEAHLETLADRGVIVAQHVDGVDRFVANASGLFKKEMLEYAGLRFREGTLAASKTT